MKINSKYKPDLVTDAAAIDSRRNLANVSIEVYKGTTVAVATDGARLVCVPVQASQDELGMIPAAVVKAAREASKQKLLEIHGADLLDGKFLKWQQCVPDGPPRFTVAFNDELLQGLCDAMGGKSPVGNVQDALGVEDDSIFSHGIIMEIRGETDPIVIRPHDPTNKAFGLLMPMLSRITPRDSSSRWPTPSSHTKNAQSNPTKPN